MPNGLLSLSTTIAFQGGGENGVWDLGSQFGQGKGDWVADTTAPGLG